MTTNYVPQIVSDTFCFNRTTQIRRACPPRSPSNTRAGLLALRRAQQFIVFRADTTAFYSARNLNSPCVTGGRWRRRGRGRERVQDTSLQISTTSSPFISRLNVSFALFRSKAHSSDSAQQSHSECTCQHVSVQLPVS
jgi:hypothetical protein